MQQVFYGWKIVGALFVLLTFSSGLSFYIHSVIIQALVNDAGFEVETASLGVSVFFLAGGLSGPLLAPLVEKHDIRLIVAFGVTVSSISLALVGFVDTTWKLMLVYVLFGIGYSGASLLPATTLIARWFEERRARALSIASTGLSVGGIVLTPVAALLIESQTLSVAMPMIGGAYFLIVLPVTWMILRSSPAEMGLHPDGEAPAVNLSGMGIAFEYAVRHHYFWGFSVAYVLTMAAQVGGIAHQYGVLSERLSPVLASWGIAVMPACSVIGRLAGAFILERVRTLPFTIFMMVIQGLILIGVGYAGSVISLYLCLAVFGLTVGNLLMLHPLIIAEVYGMKHYARLYSWSNLVMMTGVSGGPLLLGWLFGYSGDYQLPYLAAGLLGVIAALLFALLKLPEGHGVKIR